MVRIYIENQELDVMQDFSHQITYAIDDIRNIDSKSTTFSKTIVLPGTANNNNLLGNIFELTNANFTNDAYPNVGYNFNAAKSAQARIEFNGLQIMKGVMRLLEIIVDGSNIEYEIALFGELGGFINALGSKKLTGNDIVSDDLDFSEYDHEYNITNITDSWNRTSLYNISNAQFIASIHSVGLGNAYITNLNIGDSFIISGSISNDGTYLVQSISYFQFNNIWNTIIATQELTFVDEITTNITIEIPNFAGKGYVYPLIDYGNVSQSVTDILTAKHDYSIKAFRPAFFVREIIEKIIADAGYSFESKFFNTEFFNRLIIPNNEIGLINRAATEYINAASNDTYTASSNAFIPIILTNNTIINFSYNSTNGVYTYNGTIPTQIKITIIATGTHSATLYGRCGFEVISSDNGTLISADYINGTGVINANLIKIVTINPNETIVVRTKFYGNPRVGWTASLSNLDISFIVTQEPPTAIEYIYGAELNMTGLLPKNIFQKDFFINIMKLFNLYVTEDRYNEKHLHIEPYVDFYDTGNYLDWTEKVDRSEPIRIKPMSELSSRYYEFKYKSDSDYYNDRYRKTYFEGYGDRLYDNLFEFTTEKQTNEVIFSATPLVGYTGEDKVISTIFKLNNNVEEATEHNIRILQYNLIPDVSSWKIYSISGEGASQSINVFGEYISYPYAGHLDNPDVPSVDLNFGATKELYFSLVSGALSNNMFNAYYSPYMAEITDKDSRLVTARMKFNELDIFNLDFKRLIFIDNVVYRLSKIIDYSLGELCNVELLRVINTTYFDIASTPTFTLGQEYGGGIISYIDETGQHGLIRARDEVAYYMTSLWQFYYTYIGATSTSYGDGYTNSHLIVDNFSLETAAQHCIEFTGGGFNDWFLPTRDELSNIFAAGQLPTTFPYDDFWSSSEISASDANTIDKYGNNNSINKTNIAMYLPCRYF